MVKTKRQAKQSVETRTRWKSADFSEATITELANALDPFAVKKSFLMYDGESTDGKWTVRPGDLLQKKEVLHALWKLHDRMGFTKAQVTGALTLLAERKKGQKGWTIPEELFDQWLANQDTRLRTMARQISQAQCKGKQPSWLQAMPWVGVQFQDIRSFVSIKQNVEAKTPAPSPLHGEQAEQGQAEQKQAQQEQQQQHQEPGHSEDKSNVYGKPSYEEEQLTLYFFGYSSSAKAAWRSLKSWGDQAHSHKEWSSTFVWPQHAQNTDRAAAKWSDGMDRVMPEVSVAMARHFEEIRPKRKEQFTLTHAIKKTSLRVCARSQKDRDMLVRVFENGKSVATVPTKYFATHANALDDDPLIVEAATQFMQKLAESYANDEIKEKDLMQERDARLEAAGLGKSKATLKRPAATTLKRPTASSPSAPGAEVPEPKRRSASPQPPASDHGHDSDDSMLGRPTKCAHAYDLLYGTETPE